MSKAPTKTKAQQKQRDIQDKVGKSLNNPEVKDLVGTRLKKQTKEILNIEHKTRAMNVEAGITLRSGKKQIPLNIIYFVSESFQTPGYERSNQGQHFDVS